MSGLLENGKTGIQLVGRGDLLVKKMLWPGRVKEAILKFYKRSWVMQHIAMKIVLLIANIVIYRDTEPTRIQTIPPLYRKYGGILENYEVCVLSISLLSSVAKNILGYLTQGYRWVTA